jgi:hypothetical protein
MDSFNRTEAGTVKHTKKRWSTEEKNQCECGAVRGLR